MEFEAVIGLEVHAQLLTESKIFTPSSARFGGDPNTQTDPVVLGLPGVLPVLNRRAVDFAMKMALATNSRITPLNTFARKHYFYPDLPKGYQISQFDLPLCTGGYIEIDLEEGGRKKIGLTRIHMEEDAGKSIHDANLAGEDTLVDLNRSGVPLIEIVSEPDIRSAREAYQYLSELKQIVTYLEICDGNMEEGSLRCDANISIRPVGESAFGVKTEVKNMNSFRNVERAINYEIERQTRMVLDGERIVQETLLWDANAGVARTMRSKEEAHDYRYFPEPDLLPLEISTAWIEEVRATLPELPRARRERLAKQYGIPEYDAEVLCATRDLADYYEEAAKHCGDPKLVSNWIMSDVLRILNEQKIDIGTFSISPQRLAGLINLILDDTISSKIAKAVFEDMLTSPEEARAIVEAKGLVQISDSGELEALIDQILADNPNQVEQFRSGKDKLFGFFVGQVMKATSGQANPQMVNDILRKKL
ncbi:MAG TPA: Asp-tRNA(Asn)/Glu-tRNA(Gln) amidotransferase subunit GatB [Calditrichia bacterium]|nr:Asp-tRNA(Asn)/Glu-tRNA(Gln) amidotransferase subunit GatB [Calditrichota bacterium]HQU73369.1 Asp-tRNA(Asn)/Glu-tRNA(Gln) amidotransferase subunit GatB [Calditrichia bacterium]HQV30605.1 Asp-tRNA(Asn)/Glu-tRNA(Gln) amidotransferase subunit GatB [Calditrichia bacterium]